MSEIINHTDAAFIGIQKRAQELLGSGVQSSIVAQTLGVTESYISQLLADEVFLRGVVDLRYKALAKHNERDGKYDAIEDTLLDRLKETLPLLFDPMKIVKCIQVINSAKRRGQEESGSITQHNTVVNLTMPIAVMQRFQIKKDANNQVIEAGEQQLVTLQSGSLLELAAKVKKVNGDDNEISNEAGIAPPRIG